MAGTIGEHSVDVAESISTPEEEAPPSPPPTDREISDIEEDEFPSVEEIRAATTVVTPLPPGIPFFLQNSAPPLTIVEPLVVSTDFIGDQLRNSIALSTKGSEVYNALTSALSVHASEMAERLRKGKESSDLAHNDALVTNSLLRRLKTSSLSDDDDEDNDTPAEAAQREVIRKRKTRRLLEKKKQESVARNSVMAPSEPLPPNRRLSNHYDFLAVLLWLRDLEEVVVRKDWSSAI